MTEVPLGQGIEIMAVGARVQHVGFEHRIVLDAIQRDAVVCEYVAVVLQVVAQLRVPAGLQPGTQPFQGRLPTQLRLGILSLMRQRQIPAPARLDAEREPHHPRLHVVETRGLRVERHQVGRFQPLEHCGEFLRTAHRAVLGAAPIGTGLRRTRTRRIRWIEFVEPAPESEAGVEFAQARRVGLRKGQFVLVDPEFHVPAHRDQLARQRQSGRGRAQVLTHLAADRAGILQHRVEATVQPDPFRGGLRADLVHTGHVVHAVADEGQEVHDLPGSHAELLAHAIRIQHRAGHGVDQGHTRVDQLGQILVAGRDHHRFLPLARLLGQRGDHVVRLHAGNAEEWQTHRPNQLVQRRDLHRKFLRHRGAVRLVLLVQILAEGPSGCVENHRHAPRRIVRAQLAQHVRDTVQRPGRLAVGCGQRRQRMEGAVEIG
jgi:hypothetical protein